MERSPDAWEANPARRVKMPDGGYGNVTPLLHRPSPVAILPVLTPYSAADTCTRTVCTTRPADGARPS